MERGVKARELKAGSSFKRGAGGRRGFSLGKRSQVTALPDPSPGRGYLGEKSAFSSFVSAIDVDRGITFERVPLVVENARY